MNQPQAISMDVEIDSTQIISELSVRIDEMRLDASNCTSKVSADILTNEASRLEIMRQGVFRFNIEQSFAAMMYLQMYLQQDKNTVQEDLFRGRFVSSITEHGQAI